MTDDSITTDDTTESRAQGREGQMEHAAGATVAG